MRSVEFVFVLLFAATATHAQQVVASAGNSGAMTGYVVDWTLGEPVIETFPGIGNTLTQGMQQTKLLITAIDPVEIPGMEIKVYPNPTGDLLKIEITQTGSKILLYELLDISGRRVVMKEMRSNPEEIDMNGYVSGIYLLRVMDSDQRHISIFKIVKQ